MGTKNQAISVAEDALIELRAQFPEDHPHVLTGRGNLAVYRIDLGHVEAGLTELETGLSTDTESKPRTQFGLPLC